MKGRLLDLLTRLTLLTDGLGSTQSCGSRQVVWRMEAGLPSQCGLSFDSNIAYILLQVSDRQPFLGA